MFGSYSLLKTAETDPVTPVYFRPPGIFLPRMRYAPSSFHFDFWQGQRLQYISVSGLNHNIDAVPPDPGSTGAYRITAFHDAVLQVYIIPKIDTV